MGEEKFDSWCCPSCGWDSQGNETDDNPVFSDMEHNPVNRERFGGDPCDWIETWTCPECGTVFNFWNSNY